MISPACAQIGDLNRRLFDGNSLTLWKYPEGCECACAHEETLQWEKCYSAPRPRQVALDVKEIL